MIKIAMVLVLILIVVIIIIIIIIIIAIISKIAIIIKARRGKSDTPKWRSVKKAQYPSVKEPVGLSRSDGKRPDGATQISRKRGKPLAWDITIPDTFANSYIGDTSTQRLTERQQTKQQNTQIWLRRTTSCLSQSRRVEHGTSWHLNLSRRWVEE